MRFKILVNIGSGNGLVPNRCQAITWTNDELSAIEPLGTKLGKIGIKMETFLIKEMSLNMLSAKWWLLSQASVC